MLPLFYPDFTLSSKKRPDLCRLPAKKSLESKASTSPLNSSPRITSSKPELQLVLPSFQKVTTLHALRGRVFGYINAHVSIYFKTKKLPYSQQINLVTKMSAVVFRLIMKKSYKLIKFFSLAYGYR